ncbi:MAG: 3-oxoacyl-ACP synthase [Flammeovirgaceae bacterium]|nr:3-oxoacyl-ACP synthase [Flammeovirgaceae bacterium]
MKERLFAYCQDYVTERVDYIKKAMEAAQAAANEEGKSSAGDKYETGRAMMQIERDKNAVQLAEAMKLQQVMSQLSPQLEFDKSGLGALIETNQGTFYLSISIGKICLEGKDYFAISPGSPIGIRLSNLKKGDSINFNNKIYEILKVS